MSNQDKPAAREWWIEREQGSNRALLYEPGEIIACDAIHVIEYAAYETLKADYGTCSAERDTLKAENEALRWPSSEASKQHYRHVFKTIEECQDFYCGYIKKQEAENEKLRASKLSTEQTMESLNLHFNVRTGDLKLELSAERAKCKEFEAALEFYADGKHVEHPSFKNSAVVPEVIDDGETAREVLAKHGMKP